MGMETVYTESYRLGTEKIFRNNLTRQVMPIIDFSAIVKEAWQAYDNTREIIRIVDISAMVSTNHVYRVTFKDRSFIIAKLSYYGQYEHFVEDHTIINSLSNNLPAPFENLLARSLMKGNELFVYRFKNIILDAWVVFYRPIKIKQRLPRRLDEDQIIRLGEQVALFHKACDSIRHTLPPSSKTLQVDINSLLHQLQTEEGRYEHRGYETEIERQCALFTENYDKSGAESFDKIPVFVDWNIGNFSVSSSFRLYSRWDYDWFRMDSRILDFYFLSRVVSDIGDRTVFSYYIGPLMEKRFLLFLESYHEVYPLTEKEIRFLKEAYRFFILNYVIKDGRYFFHEVFATKLQKEAHSIYLPSIEKEFNADVILKALNI
jgi:Ser/Thr protein kinase RdoA (MazF antagonist)